MLSLAHLIYIAEMVNGNREGGERSLDSDKTSTKRSCSASLYIAPTYILCITTCRVVFAYITHKCPICLCLA